MKESWREIAVMIGKAIRENARTYPELIPLLTAFVNFARKHSVKGVAVTKSKGAVMGVNPKRVRTALAALDRAGLAVVDREDYEKLIKACDRQNEEIEAL